MAPRTPVQAVTPGDPYQRIDRLERELSLARAESEMLRTQLRHAVTLASWGGGRLRERDAA